MKQLVLSSEYAGVDCYRLVDVQIGNVSVMARPSGWDREDFTGAGIAKDGETVNAMTFITTCPHCSALLTFNRDEVFVVNNINMVECHSCDKLIDDKYKVAPVDESVRTELLPPKVAARISTACSFRDPLFEGLLVLDIDDDIQALIDKNPEFN